MAACVVTLISVALIFLDWDVAFKLRHLAAEVRKSDVRRVHVILPLIIWRHALGCIVADLLIADAVEPAGGHGLGLGVILAVFAQLCEARSIGKFRGRLIILCAGLFSIAACAPALAAGGKAEYHAQRHKQCGTGSEFMLHVDLLVDLIRPAL